MHVFKASVHAECTTDLLKASGGQPATSWQTDIMFRQVDSDLTRKLDIVGVAVIVTPVPVQHTAICCLINVVHRPVERRQTSGDQRCAQMIRRCRQVMCDAEAAETLAQDAPMPLLAG